MITVTALLVNIYVYINPLQRNFRREIKEGCPLSDKASSLTDIFFQMTQFVTNFNMKQNVGNSV